MDLTQLGLIMIIALLSMAAGYLFAHFRQQRENTALREQNIELRTNLEHLKSSQQEQSASYEKTREQLNATFAQLSSEALKHNSGEFLKLAQENLKQFHLTAQHELDKKEKNIETLIKPIRDALDKTEKQIREIEAERKQHYGSLSKHLESMAQSQSQLQHETRNLVQALRRPEVRGQWGELTLKRLAELAGMVEHCDFYEQEQITTEQGRMRPDMVIRLPDKRDIIVDVKTPLDAYLNATEATDDALREQYMVQHTRNVRERVRELSSKAYWDHFTDAPDFVVLFIPGDQFLSAALERDRDLLEDALRQQVMLATPTSFIALLRAVAYGWRQEALAENADHIRAVGEELYDRLATFGKHLGNVGSSLNSAIGHFNRAVGSYDSRVLPGARKFKEMGVSSKKATANIEQVESIAREPVEKNDDTSL
ncbi:MAG: DNA recombination protein RmuC [Granulosicoccaceae bacterium]